MDQGFKKHERLKSKKLIDLLFSEGRSMKSFPIKLVYVPIKENEDIQLQTAISVPKKLIKTAVKRNRIKRLMREVFRKNKYLVTNQLSTSHAFMLIYISRDEMPYEKLEASMIKVLKQFSEKN